MLAPIDDQARLFEQVALDGPSATRLQDVPTTAG